MTNLRIWVLRLTGRFARQEEGMVAVIVALLMVVMLGFAAMVLDTGILFAQRTQMQKAVDAAALAGAYALWPVGSSTPAAAALSYAGLNGVSSTELTFNDHPTDTSIWSPTSEAWMVTASRSVPLIFAPVLGLSQSTIMVSAVAINSPLSGCASPSCILPYAIWGGNNPSGGDSPNGTWCAGLLTPPENPCPSVPGSFRKYDWTYLEPATNVPNIIYRDNGWSSDVVWPNGNNCYTPPANGNGNGNGGAGNGNGNGNGSATPVCTNANWIVNPQNNFKGFFNNYDGLELTAGTLLLNAYSQGGNSSEPFNIMCQILARNSPSDRVAIMPIVDWAQQTSGNTGTLNMHIKVMVAIQLDSLSGCGGGNAMGTLFTGTVLPQYDIPKGNGHGPQDSPVHVVKLWQ